MFSKFCQECGARLNFVGKTVDMIPFTCELNFVNIAGGVPSPATTGLLSEAHVRDDARDEANTKGSLALTPILYMPLGV